MYYAVVAPDFSNIYTEYKRVERARVFYPYLKWKKCYTESQAAEFISRNKTSKKVALIYNYGETFKDKYILANYKIHDDHVTYLLDTKKLGRITIDAPGCLVQYERYKIELTVPNVFISDTTIGGHMSAIYTLLSILGEYVDVNIVLPNYSVFYALAYYSQGRHREVSLVHNLINQRCCKVGYTLKQNRGEKNK